MYLESRADLKSDFQNFNLSNSIQNLNNCPGLATICTIVMTNWYQIWWDCVMKMDTWKLTAPQVLGWLLFRVVLNNVAQFLRN